MVHQNLAREQPLVSFKETTVREELFLGYCEQEEDEALATLRQQLQVDSKTLLLRGNLYRDDIVKAQRLIVETSKTAHQIHPALILLTSANATTAAMMPASSLLDLVARDEFLIVASYLEEDSLYSLEEAVSTNKRRILDRSLSPATKIALAWLQMDNRRQTKQPETEPTSCCCCCCCCLSREHRSARARSVGGLAYFSKRMEDIYAKLYYYQSDDDPMSGDDEKTLTGSQSSIKLEDLSSRSMPFPKDIFQCAQSSDRYFVRLSGLIPKNHNHQNINNRPWSWSGFVSNVTVDHSEDGLGNKSIDMTLPLEDICLQWPALQQYMEWFNSIDGPSNLIWDPSQRPHTKESSERFWKHVLRKVQVTLVIGRVDDDDDDDKPCTRVKEYPSHRSLFLMSTVSSDADSTSSFSHPLCRGKYPLVSPTSSCCYYNYKSNHHPPGLVDDDRHNNLKTSISFSYNMGLVLSVDL